MAHRSASSARGQHWILEFGLELSPDMLLAGGLVGWVGGGRRLRGLSVACGSLLRARGGYSMFCFCTRGLGSSLGGTRVPSTPARGPPLDVCMTQRTERLFCGCTINYMSAPAPPVLLPFRCGGGGGMGGAGARNWMRRCVLSTIYSIYTVAGARANPRAHTFSFRKLELPARKQDTKTSCSVGKEKRK